jgi:MFS family permease
MLPLSLFKVRQFTTTNAVTFVVYAGLGGALFLLPVNLQVVGHYTPLQSGLALLPLTFIMLFLSTPSGRLAARIGPRLQMSVGPVVVGLGLILLSRAGSDTSYVSGVLPAVIVFGLGLATTVAPLTATALNSVSEDRSGLASAVNNVVARVGSLIAVAILPGIAGIGGSAYLNPAALGHGFKIASIVAGTWCVAGGILAAIGIRNPPPEAGAAPQEVEAAPMHCGLDATQLGART